MRNPAALSVLRQNPIFSGVSADSLANIEALCRNRNYRRGELVFEEGTAGIKLYGVIAGRLLITASSPKGSQLNLNVLGPGEIVGEIAFLDGGLRTATGRAAEQSTCFEIDRAAFFGLLHRSPELGAHLLQLVCRRVRWMTKLVADSAFLSVSERLATRLRDLAEAYGKNKTDMEVKISQAELAQFLGISRQVVNGYLRAWQKAGRVELGRGSIRIRNIAEIS
jgi:CRP/FNR family transcriptional regulator, cyclic AMP receptor protein